MLIPFYIVALAAIATFAGDKIDDIMKGDPATLRLRGSAGTYLERELTRRQFLCYLFGYLATASLFVYVSILVVDLVADDAGQYFAALLYGWFQWARVGVMFVCLFPIWQIIVATMLGVYFMSDRLQVMDDPNLYRSTT